MEKKTSACTKNVNNLFEILEMKKVNEAKMKHKEHSVLYF